MARHDWFQIVSRPLPSALGVLRFGGDGCAAALSRGQLPGADSDGPRLVTLVGADSGLCGKCADGSYWFTPHGGGGVMTMLRSALLSRGFRERIDSDPDPDFVAALPGGVAGACRYHREALRLLPEAPSATAAQMLLRAMDRDVPTQNGVDAWRFKADWAVVRRWMTRPRVVLLGKPNAGKSTLYNALIDQGSAIISDEAGTTRDVVSGSWTLPNGAVVELADMPGMRDGAGVAEQAGLEIAAEWARRADCRLVLAPFNQPRPLFDGIHVATMCDLGPPPHWADVAISSASGEGLDQLASAVAGHLFPPVPNRLLPLSAEMAADAGSSGFWERWFGS